MGSYTAFAIRLCCVFFLPIVLSVVHTSAIEEAGRAIADHNSGYESEQQAIFDPVRHDAKQSHPEANSLDLSEKTVGNALQDLHSALSTMQSTYFSLWLGKWTSAIDWTAAVMGTHLSSTLTSLSSSLPYTLPGTFDKSRKLDVEAQMIENEINKYFAQSITYYFGEDVFGLRNQAYDDMLWVVLGWLESIRFIDQHTQRHYPLIGIDEGQGQAWHGRQFSGAFAHRARVFYELAEQGWDWELCGGGMVWAPQLGPYKNAITNELFISASIGMYLDFPGDDNCSPFLGLKDTGKGEDRRKLQAQELGKEGICDEKISRSTYDPIYLAAAVNGYDWLKNSGMTNDQGLYVDGFHIHDYGKNGTIGTGKCDERNEMVYTYNQGVILSGLRGLWEGTGNLTYLEDGHELIRNVIRATGWNNTDITPTVFFGSHHRQTKAERAHRLGPNTLSWAGLGSFGVLAELCDPHGTCSQNDQTFKGIFFHHLTAFCTALPSAAVEPGKTHGASKEMAKLHKTSCNEYAPWVVHNAHAALNTRDEVGRFGMWWGAAFEDQGALDAYNHGKIPLDHSKSEITAESKYMFERSIDPAGDLNDRGRGRTVETQGGGVAVTRAMWEFLRNLEE